MVHAADRPRSITRRILRVGLVLLVLVLILAAGAILWGRHQLLASLPLLEGTRATSDISATVLVKRDALGIPTIQGSTRADIAWATGFVHAQDRFFQMDLSRRRAAGELSELVGAAALETDRQARVHRFRARARLVVQSGDPAIRAMLEAYSKGVNAGLRSLGGKPFEYFVLRSEPAPWKPEDCILVVASMFFFLQDSTGAWDWGVGLVYSELPRPLADFLLGPASEWEAPIIGEPLPRVPLPGSNIVDLRVRRTAPLTRPPRSSDNRQASVAANGWLAGDARDKMRFADLVPGSNNWAISGAHTASGSALIANDMHLGLSVPNTWYRASLAWTDDRPHRVTGVTLPGIPDIVVGSNGDIAWGFTNAEGDWTDLVKVEIDARDNRSYRTPSGPQKFALYDERIRVKGQADEKLTVKETIWGPVVDFDRKGEQFAVSWVPHHVEGMNLLWMRAETGRTVEDALDLAARSGIPALNLVVSDRAGNIGWTIAGRIPRRVGFDGRVPTSWADGTRRWDGWLEPSEYPRLVNPASGRIWTANQRTVSGEMLQAVGYGRYDQGARAQQIRNDIMSIESAKPRDMLGVQLDDRARFLARWRELALRVLDRNALSRRGAASAQAPARREFRRLLLESWTGRASIDSVGYRLVKAFRARVAALALDPLYDRVVRAAGVMTPAAARSQTTDGPLWTLVSEQPPHLLAPRFRSWNALLLEAIDQAIALLADEDHRLESRTWGEANTTRIRHPLSAVLPGFTARWLDMPKQALPGDGNMPRVQAPAMGASERFAVSPGREQEGYFHMPGGQSGHPLSPHYSDGHHAWTAGEPTPFLPGRTVRTLVFTRK